MTEPAVRTAEPTILRSLLLAAGAVAALIWLLPDPDVVPRDLADGREWWARTETAAAAIIVVRLIGSAMAILAGGLATLALVAALGPWVTPTRIWRRLSPTPFRRLVTASILIGIANDPVSNASAAEHDSAPLPVLADLGPSARRPSPDATPPILIDLGAVDPELTDTGVGFAAPTDPNPPTANDDRWIVEPGDHLWHIAEETLADRGVEPTTRRIERYWRRLIDANRSVVGDNPDLIRPGMEIVLPE